MWISAAQSWQARVALAPLAAVLILACTASSASAWKLTVHVHGAGNVDETTSANFTNCGSTASTTATNALQASCTEPPSGGGYCGLCIVRLHPTPAPGFVFDRWEWATSGVACDNPPPSDADPNDCQWQWAGGPGAGDYTLRAYFKDVTPPATTLTGGPAEGAFVQQRAHTFNLTSSQTPSSFRCELNDASVACGSSYSTGELPDGSYRLEAFARDASNNEDTSPEVRNWTVDNVAPTTTLSGGPLHGSRIRDRNATFNVVSSEALGAVQCALNDVARACIEGDNTLSDLPDGTYTFAARSVDRAGNQGVSVSRSWTVDNDPPLTTLTGGPANGSLVNSRSAQFTIGIDEAAAVACELDGAALPCDVGQLELAGLGDGTHALSVRATDTAGNQEPTPIARTWQVDATAPDTTIVSGPGEGAVVSEPEAVFRFRGAGTGGRYECRLDRGSFAPCSVAEGHRTGALAIGTHTLEVRAIDAATNADGSPASRTWTVVAADEDGDGSPRGVDCNDADPSVRPGGREVPGNGKDDDCNGGDARLLDTDGDGIADPADRCPNVAKGAFDADRDGCVGPYRRFIVTSGGFWTVTARGLAVKEFHVTGAPKGAKVEVLCIGRKRKCSYAQRLTATGRKVIRLTKLRGKLLKPGTRFAVRVTAPGWIGDVVARRVNRSGKTRAAIRRFARKPFKSTRQCLPAGSLIPAKTCSSTPATGP